MDNVDDEGAPRSPRLLEVAHVAHRLSVTQGFVLRLIRDRKLAGIHIGNRWRVEPEVLQAFIDSRRTQCP